MIFDVDTLVLDLRPHGGLIHKISCTPVWFLRSQKQSKKIIFVVGSFEIKGKKVSKCFGTTVSIAAAMSGSYPSTEQNLIVVYNKLHFSDKNFGFDRRMISVVAR